MLKHVTYRSTSSLAARENDFCRSCSLSPGVMNSVALSAADLRRKRPSVARGELDNMSLKGAIFSRNDDFQDCESQFSLKDFQSPDNVSLHSSLSYASLPGGGRLSSRYSSTASLTSQPQEVPLKVFVRSLRPDIEYKTLSLSTATTCRELIRMLLTKFRLRHRDPNLFFVTMEVEVRAPGGGPPVRRMLVLNGDARPAELQQCHPRGQARFSIGMRRGGLIRVYDSILMAGSQYKSLLVSYTTTSEELVQLLLNCYNNRENPNNYSIHELCKNPYTDRPLSATDMPLQIQSSWSKSNRHNYAFVLRRNIIFTMGLKSRLSWRKSLDQSSTDTESEIEDHNTTSGSLLSSFSNSSSSSKHSGFSFFSLASSRSSSSGVFSSNSTPTKSPFISPMGTPPSTPPAILNGRCSSASSFSRPKGFPSSLPNISSHISLSLIATPNSESPLHTRSDDSKLVPDTRSKMIPTTCGQSSPISLKDSISSVSLKRPPTRGETLPPTTPNSPCRAASITMISSETKDKPSSPSSDLSSLLRTSTQYLVCSKGEDSAESKGPFLGSSLKSESCSPTDTSAADMKERESKVISNIQHDQKSCCAKYQNCFYI